MLIMYQQEKKKKYWIKQMKKIKFDANFVEEHSMNRQEKGILYFAKLRLKKQHSKAKDDNVNFKN